MGEQIAQPVIAAFHRRNDLMIAVILESPAVAATVECACQDRQRGVGVAIGQPPFSLLLEAAQRIGLDRSAEPHHLPPHPRNLPVQANAGGQNQASENGDKPAGAINAIQAKVFKDFKPERPELEDVIGIRLILL